ncbi:MAG: class I SAM-dependent methyltransferase [Mycobacteriales bacterium]
MTNLWTLPEHVSAYLAAADGIPHRSEGEAALLEHLPAPLSRVLDLGCGDGRLLALVRLARPGVAGVAVDFSPSMLEAARARFASNDDVEVVAHDLDEALVVGGPFDAVVSSFAIHHVGDVRKKSLYAEVFDLLRPGGVFLNLEHVASPTPELHRDFYLALGADPADEDVSNQLADAFEQVQWMREVGFDHVDVHWKWRELALLGAVRPA